MSSSQHAFTQVAHADLAFAPERLDAFVDRLRSVRRKVGRWLPSAESLVARHSDRGEIFRAAIRLDLSVRALESRVRTGGAPTNDDAALEAWTACPPRDLPQLLHEVEACAGELESVIVQNVPAGRCGHS